MINTIIVNHIAERAFALMQRKNLVIQETGRPIFYAWPRDDRVILVVDPEMVKNQQRMLSDEFRHDLSTVLAGRRVVTTNSRGIFIQVAWQADPAPRALRRQQLDVTGQPSPLHVPIGMTRNGPLWLSIPEMDAVLIGGSRRMGKTRLVHGWIQALIRGGQTDLYLYDGKGGVEFSRYSGQTCVRLAEDLRGSLMQMQLEMARRGELLKQANLSSVAEYNQQAGERLPVIVLIIDEVAHIPDDCQAMVGELVGKGGAYGIYPVLATTYPGHKQVQSLVRANLSTRIALPVPTQAESRVILGQGGAETLPKVKGRLLLVWEARLVEAQAFEVRLPESGTAYLGPALTEKEQEIARTPDGQLSIRLLMQRHGMSEWDARRLLKDWEGRGWLETDRHHGNARRISPLLTQVLTQSAQATQSHQRPQSEENNEPIG